MAIRGLEGNQNAQPRVFAHDALDLQESGYVLGTAIPNTDTIGVCLYVGVANDITVKMEGGSTVKFKGVTAGSFLPVLVTQVTDVETALTEPGELIALY
ncbi:hypothetical protein N9K77_00115 [bacterium]|nr:hypothetical protein [bacterium]